MKKIFSLFLVLLILGFVAGVAMANVPSPEHGVSVCMEWPDKGLSFMEAHSTAADPIGIGLEAAIVLAAILDKGDTMLHGPRLTSYPPDMVLASKKGSSLMWSGNRRYLPDIG